MKILIDMNLSPDWVKVLTDAGWNQYTGQRWEICVLQMRLSYPGRVKMVT